MSEVSNQEAIPAGYVPRRAVPAWLMSVVVHLVALVILGLTFQTVKRVLDVDEGERAVSITLASVNDNQETEYFDEEDQAATSAAQAAPSPPPLPSTASEAPPLDTEIKLPGKPNTSIGEAMSAEFLTAPTLDGTGRSKIGMTDAEIAAILAEDARSRPRGPEGDSARVGIFGSAGVKGHSFIFVIDRSKSMGGDGLGVLGAASTELYGALTRLEPNHRFQIVAYNHSTLYVNKQRKLLRATPENIRKVPEYFNNMAAFGATNHLSALFTALRLKPDVIFFLTDGGSPYLNDSQIAEVVERAGRRTSIHCLQFGSGARSEEDDFMMQLANRTSGSFLYIDMSKRR